MSNRIHQVLTLTAISVFAMPALADDCASAAKSAMSNSGRTPVTIAITKTSAQGKQTTTRQVQTVTNKYVQTENGQWYVMNIAIKDLIDDLDGATVTCHRSGNDTVNGETATVYNVQVDAEETMKNNKIWVSPKNLILKSEGTIEDAHYTTLYDYAHVTPPANAKSMGSR
jgi:hypothetical protein